MGIPFSRLLEDQQVIRHPEGPQSPLVSVIMPTYKLREGMNRRAVESVLGQTFTNFEFIIVDDGSLDGLYELLQEYQQRDARIVLVRHEINSGLPAGRVDEGILLARGKFITYMFEDDCWVPEAIEHLLATAHEVGEDCLVYGSVEWTIQAADGHESHGFLGDWDFDYSSLKGDNKFANCAVLHTRGAIEQSGLYDPNILIRRASDYDLWLRMAKKVPFRRCPHVVGRVISGSKYALGATIDQDVSLTYRYINCERDDALHPGKILDYPVDVIPFATTQQDAVRIHEHYFVPFWLQHPRMLRPAERKLVMAIRAQPNRLLVTKGSYSTSIDVTLGNYSKILPSEVQSYAFLSENNLTVTNFDNFDTLVLYRTLAGNSHIYEQEARNQGKTVVYMMDDNMFKFGTGYMAEEFDYLKPDSVYYRVLWQQVEEADLVITYSEATRKDIEKYTPRVVELETNIREKYIFNAHPIPGGKSTGRRLKYALLSGPARKREIQSLWPVLMQFFDAHQEQAEFHVWGMDPHTFGESRCTVGYRPFDNSYEHYLSELQKEKFDFVLCPLFDDHETKKSKSPIKYLEASVAGAVGIFSDVVGYRKVQNGFTGLKVTGSDWLKGLEESLALSDEDRSSIFAHAKAEILESFTSEAQVFDYLSCFEAAHLHMSLRSYNSEGGRAKIAYFFHETEFGGATLHLFQHALMAQRYHFQPVLCYPGHHPLNPEFQKRAEINGLQLAKLDYIPTPWVTDLDEQGRQRSEELLEWMNETDIRLVHIVTFSAEVLWAAGSLGVPVVTTLHAFYDAPQDAHRTGLEFHTSMYRQVGAIHSSSMRYAQKWQRVLLAPSFCLRAPITRSYFETFDLYDQTPLPTMPTILISGTIQPRKRQLDAIRAVKILAKKGICVRLICLGYDTLLPDYVEKCRDEISNLGLQDQVLMPGFATDPQSYYEEADFILCSSDDESMPQSILKAMAQGKRVITTPVGGVKELILDGFSGIITDGYEASHLASAIDRAISLSPDHWKTMISNARYAAEMSCSEDLVRYQLLRLYNTACKENIRLNAETLGQRAIQSSSLVMADGMPTNSFMDNTSNVFVQRMSFRGLSYRVRVPQDGWDTLFVTFATFSQTLSHNIEVTIRSLSFPRTVLRRFEISPKQVQDNIPIMLVFQPIYGIAGSDVQVTFRSKDRRLLPLLGVYERGSVPGYMQKMMKAASGVGGKLQAVLMFSPRKMYEGRGKQSHLVDSASQKRHIES